MILMFVSMFFNAWVCELLLSLCRVSESRSSWLSIAVPSVKRHIKVPSSTPYFICNGRMNDDLHNTHRNDRMDE